MRVFTTSTLKAFVMLVGWPFKYGCVNNLKDLEVGVLD
jgi:hypothetical protein